MRAQVGQVPTPQGISVLLRKAGFSRSEQSGRSWYSSGYRVRKIHNDRVRVEHHSSSLASTWEHEAAWVAKYAKVIRDAGWQVTESEPPLWPKLVISARPVPGTDDESEG